jgi:AcrR family transcriptional regulator
MDVEAEPIPLAVLALRGRPPSESSYRAILDAFRDLLIEVGFARLRLEHVAARAGASKATIYRRWGSKEAIAIELVRELATPHAAVTDTGDARQELIAVAADVVARLTETDFGLVIRRLLSEIASNEAVSEAFRASVIDSRVNEVRGVIDRGIARGYLRADADVEITTEVLVGSIYARSLFGGTLDREYAEVVVDALLTGYATAR